MSNHLQQVLTQFINKNSHESLLNSQHTINPDRGFLHIATFRNNREVIVAQCDSRHRYQHDRVSPSAFTIHNTNPTEIQTRDRLGLRAPGNQQ